jgi:hypothetical protein
MLQNFRAKKRGLLCKIISDSSIISVQRIAHKNLVLLAAFDLICSARESRKS